MSARAVSAQTPPRAGGSARAPHRRRRLARRLAGVLVACWLLVAVAPASVAATSPPTPHAGTPAAAPTEQDALAQDAETVDEPDQADDTDGSGSRELVAGLVAVVLLAVTIGAHALYRDQR